jgi:hypothetical protein
VFRLLDVKGALHKENVPICFISEQQEVVMHGKPPAITAADNLPIYLIDVNAVNRPSPAIIAAKITFHLTARRLK